MLADISHPKTQFLNSQPWYAALPADAQARVARHVTLHTAAKGDVMLRSGEPVHGWYAVLSGLVKLQSQSEDGRLSVFLGVQAGDWFGEGSALKSEPRRYDVVTTPEFSELKRGILADIREETLKVMALDGA